MESWRKVWRNSFDPCGFSTPMLWALKKVLEDDYSPLIQGKTCSPPPLECVQDWLIEAADFTVYGCWQGDCEGKLLVGNGEELFARMCFEIDQRLGEPPGCRWLLTWFDETPRDEIRRLLLQEVDRSINLREDPKIREFFNGQKS